MKTEIYIIFIRTQGQNVYLPEFYYNPEAAKRQALYLEERNPNTPVYVQRFEQNPMGY